MNTAADVTTKKRWPMWRIFSIAYLVALLGSHIARALAPTEVPVLPAGMERVELRAVAADGSTTERRVRMAWREVSPSDAPVVLAIHGSPSNGEEMRQVAELLGNRYRVIWMHLPGFGRSTRELPDYSFATHARYLAQFVEKLDVERVHVVGFSMGGGVALELEALLDERCASITLVSAIGVQELEWLGDYALNHGVHGLQVALLWALRECVPHFGALDDTILSVEYARNFYDSDQRPLRDHLLRLEQPFLVIHGREDSLVPFDAALEHHRIVPQSELVVLDGDHFAVFIEPKLVATPLRDFLDRVESGTALRRADAAPERHAAALEPFDPTGASIVGFALIAICVMLALATLVSEDLTCVLAGALVVQERIDFVPAALACFLGIYIGDLLLFYAGRVLGSKALSRAPLRWLVSPTRAERASEWLERRGLAVIFISRFTPGMRLPTYFASGALGARTSTFALYFAIAAGIWTPLLVWLSSLLGDKLIEGLDVLQQNFLLALVVTVVTGYVLVKVVQPLLSWRGRRRLVGAWRRWVYWEFWPPWVFYPPIIVWMLWLAVRHRSATVWCAANPGIEGGGVVGESKNAILHALASRSPALEAVLPWCLLPAALPPEERVARFDAFRTTHGLDFPIVVKPDAGQRGSGVTIANNSAEAHTYIQSAAFDLIAQAYAPGVEFGVFYARRPGDAAGQIISITEKHLASVMGDGEHTLEELILRDSRAVCLADYYLHKNHVRANEVPAAGERVVIGNLGTHARGAIFRDANELATPELVAAVDAISKCFDGFFFGRYDVRVPSRDALARGENLRVIELNGVTSESTHVYDARHSALHGWRVFGAQWSLAFEIGAQNRARGAPVPRLLDLARAWRDYRRAQVGHQGG